MPLCRLNAPAINARPMAVIAIHGLIPKFKLKTAQTPTAKGVNVVTASHTAISPQCIARHESG